MTSSLFWISDGGPSAITWPKSKTVM